MEYSTVKRGNFGQFLRFLINYRNALGVTSVLIILGLKRAQNVEMKPIIQYKFIFIYDKTGHEWSISENG